MRARTGHAPRVGIGEWYRRPFADLSDEERRDWAAREPRQRGDRPVCHCLTEYRLLRADAAPTASDECSKQGGICSLRQYVQTAGGVEVAPGPAGRLCTVCPERFREGNRIYQWVGTRLLGTDSPIVLGEIGFLKPTGHSDDATAPPRDVGKIDNILVHPDTSILNWCALEIQAVYASNSAYSKEFRAIASFEGAGIPWPQTKPNLDYRSSSLKRLMPQLQVKVPSLRRWGRKMAVVVDECFFEQLGGMDTVGDVSNCDVVWFVVGYDHSGCEAQLCLRHVQMTTLERTVEGLTAGHPSAMGEFENSIRAKLGRRTC